MRRASSSLAITLVMISLLPGCFLFRAGGEAGGIRRRGYDFDRTLLWQACVETIQAEGYKLAVADAVHGRIQSAILETRSGEGRDVNLWLKGKPTDWALTVLVTRYSRLRDQWTAGDNLVLLEERMLAKIEQRAQELFRQDMRENDRR